MRYQAALRPDVAVFYLLGAVGYSQPHDAQTADPDTALAGTG